MNNNYNNQNNGLNNNQQMGYNPNNLNQTGNNLGTSSNQSNNYVNGGQASSSRPITSQVNNSLNPQQNLNSGVVNNSQVSNVNTNVSQMVNNNNVVNSTIQPNNISNDKFCGKCGNKLSGTDVFCGVCGERVNNGQPQTNNRPLVDNYYTNQSNNGLNNDEDLRRAYIGNKYLDFKKGGVSFLSLFVGPLYLVYRKMYLIGFLWLVISNILTLFLPTIGMFAHAGMAIFMLIKFKDLYLKHVDKKIEEIKNNNRSMDRNQLLDLCSKKGGTNVGLVIGTIVGSFVLTVFIATPIIMGTIDDAIENANDRNNSNEYEEDNNYYEENNESNTSSSATIIFQGFKFNKVKGYTYQNSDNTLEIRSNDYLIQLTIAKANFNELLSEIETLKQELKNQGLPVYGGDEETYLGRKFIAYDITDGDVVGVLFVAEGNPQLSIQGIIIDRNNSTSHLKLEEVSKVLEGITYIGGYSDYSSDFSGGINLDNIEN